MAKLLWVAMPLLVALAAWALLALRGRMPSRQALNVWSSLLLVVYVLSTAGLGVFWVASQQLPVFDWHYLFGYATLALIVLHLSLNLGTVWRYLTRWPQRREPARAVEPREERQRGRRTALGWSAAALASGAAFWLGWLRGRTDATTTVAAAGAASVAAPATDPVLAEVERFHALSSHSRRGLLLRAPSVDWGGSPSAFKRYPGASRLALPTPPARESTALDAAGLGHVLWHVGAVTERRGGLELRASPSSGALFPTELYVVCRAVDGVPDGAWHYDAASHALESVAPATPLRDRPDDLDRAGARAPACRLIATAVFRRTGHKYRDRTYRYVLADLGHALENLRVAAASVGLATRFVAGFDQAGSAASIGVDDVEEGVLAVALLSPRGVGEDPGRAGEEAPTEPVRAASAPTATALGATAAIHAVTSIRRPAPSGTTAAIGADPEGAATIALPAPAPTLQADRSRLIARRRSIRRFSAEALPLADLSACLAATTLATPTFTRAVRLDVVVDRVAGVRAGAFRYDAAGHALRSRRDGDADLSTATRAAGLDQDVIGDAAVVLVVSVDRRVIAGDPLGAGRGYRHGFLEAGLVGERVYLEAVARRLGACSVGAFYDDETAALVGTDPAREWVVHLVALGVPAAA
jgi:SagB-type dehydrogenase family enzyme